MQTQQVWGEINEEQKDDHNFNQNTDRPDHIEPNNLRSEQIEKEQRLPSKVDTEEDLRARFSQLHPAQQKTFKHGALQFDIKLGWIPKAQITGPIPIAFAHPDMDQLLSEGIDRQSWVYYGYRPTNSFDLHRKFYNSGQNYPFNQFHLCKSQFLERFFKKYYSDLEFESVRKQGMLISECPLVFDSFFEGGNLDAVYYEQNEYKLVIRVDTNTKGHSNYYYFKVKCCQPGKYTFRIVNMSKPKSLYQRGMRPYVRTNEKGGWAQACSNVRYGLSKLCEEYEFSKKVYSLKFQYQFSNKEEVVQFCYGIPYTYSDLLKQLNSYRSHPFFHLNKLCYTLSGVEIPLVTITGPDKQDSDNIDKYVIGLSARAHPGETHGSHVLNGFIKALLSSNPEAQMLRKNIIFKIIPMINPDGVIAGNTRTSLSGKDLNRVYSDKTDFVFPEIIGMRDFVKKMKQKYGQRLLFFIDLHGHSTRKNSFFFGPEFSVFDEQYQKCRMLAKIYANITDIFRYYSCKFRLSSFKQKTCRGYFNSNNIVRTYTFQTSMHCFFNFNQRGDEPFSQAKLEELGQNLMHAVYQFTRSTMKLSSNKIEDPVDKKKVFWPALKQEKPEDENSDQMQSNQADSQDSADDFGSNHLQVFYNRINENREYFYEELLQVSNQTYTRPEKKKKNNQVEQKPFEEAAVLPSSKDQPSAPAWNKTTKARSEWIPKLNFEVRKKQFVSYEKLSNVVFGNASDANSIIEIKNNLLYSSRPSLPFELSKSKYTFVNPILDQKSSTKSFSLSNKVPEFKLSSKSRFFKKEQKEQAEAKIGLREVNETKSRTSSQLNYNSAEVQIQLKSQSRKAANFYNQSELQKLILQRKEYGILTESQSKKSLKQDPKHLREIKKSKSQRVLPRKKSIKSFRNQEEKLNKKIMKNMSEKGLAAKLPYLEKAIANY